MKDLKFRDVMALPPLQKSHPQIYEHRGGLQKRDYNISLQREKIWIIRMKKFLGLPHCFFFRMAAPFNLVEVNRPSPHDPILLT
jgi:hypothetical protein